MFCKDLVRDLANPLDLVEEDKENKRTLRRRCRDNVANLTQLEVEIEDEEPSIIAKPRKILSKY